jgi:hypothetical protein
VSKPLTPERRELAERLLPLARYRVKRFGGTHDDELLSVAQYALCCAVASWNENGPCRLVSYVCLVIDRALRREIRSRHVTNCDLSDVASPEPEPDPSHAIPAHLLPLASLRAAGCTQRECAAKLGARHIDTRRMIRELEECLK